MPNSGPGNNDVLLTLQYPFRLAKVLSCPSPTIIYMLWLHFGQVQRPFLVGKEYAWFTFLPFNASTFSSVVWKQAMVSSQDACFLRFLSVGGAAYLGFDEKSSH